MSKLLAVATLGLSLGGCATMTDQSLVVKENYTANATWYSHGKVTASGEKFKPDGISVAHRTLPFGTQLRITNPANGTTIIARVNDRGPFVKNVSLDLSRGAAHKLGMLRTGRAPLEVEVLEDPVKKEKQPLVIEAGQLAPGG